MAESPSPIDLTEEQVLYFRARRGHLAGPGAADPVAAARAVVGAQSQQEPPSLLALSLRTADRPTAEELRRRLFVDRDLVRTWGQRDTLHVFDPADWADVVAAREQWAPGGRRGAMPPAALEDKALEVLEAAPGPITRQELFPLLPASYLEEAKEKMGKGGDVARRFAAGRLLWRLAHRGDGCLADKVGTEQGYVARSAWFPELPWPEPEPLAAAARLTRRYLAVYGPATATDVAHFFGARVGTARGWLDVLEGDSALIPVRCGERKGLVALAEDVDDLTAEPPAGARDWPVRLLPLWDTMLMGHADKSWTVPDEDERKVVWRKAGYIAASVVARGRVVAVWTQKKRGRRLRVEVEPLGRWRAAKHAAGARREAEAVAACFGFEGADVAV